MADQSAALVIAEELDLEGPSSLAPGLHVAAEGGKAQPMGKRGFSAVLAAVLWTAGVSAHHPFSADFDTSQTFTLSGTVTRVEWQNPHVYAYIDAKDAQGKVVNWKVEMGSPSALMKEGWTQTSIKTGEMVTVKAWKSKHNPTLVNADTFMIGGKTMTVASSFSGAPSDQLADSSLSSQTDLLGAQPPQAVGTAGSAQAEQATGTAGTQQDLPATGSPLALYLLLGGLSLAGAAGFRAIRRSAGARN